MGADGGADVTLGAAITRIPPLLADAARIRHTAASDDTPPVKEPVDDGGPVAALQPLDLATRLRLAETLGDLLNGAEGRYTTTLDGGLAGLQWGLFLFDQASGALGAVLAAAYRRETAATEDQLHTALGLPAAPEGERGSKTDAVQRLVDQLVHADRATRLAEFEGAALSHATWRARFEAAGALPQVMAAQREVAVTQTIDPVITWALPLGLHTDRALLFAIDRVVHMGEKAGKAWVVQHAGAIRTRGERLGAEQATGIHSETWSTAHHLALTTALRAHPTRSPVPLPGVHTLIDRMVLAGRLDPRIGPRVDRLVATASLHDHVLRPE